MSPLSSPTSKLMFVTGHLLPITSGPVSHHQASPIQPSMPHHYPISSPASRRCSNIVPCQPSLLQHHSLSATTTPTSSSVGCSYSNIIPSWAQLLQHHPPPLLFSNPSPMGRRCSNFVPCRSPLFQLRPPLAITAPTSPLRPHISLPQI